MSTTYPTKCPTCGETVIVVISEPIAPTVCTCGQVALASTIGGQDRISWSLPAVRYTGPYLLGYGDDGDPA